MDSALLRDLSREFRNSKLAHPGTVGYFMGLMNYPLDLRFKFFALASQISATDSEGRITCYVKQKLFKLKEHINVYSDEEMQQPLCDIRADKVLDFSAKYTFTDQGGQSFGSVARKGMRSLWKAHYQVFDAEDQLVMEIREENPWAKVLDGVLGEIPIVGFFTGYMIHPRFLVTNADGQALFRATKQPALFEGQFRIEEVADLPERDELRAVLSILMMLLLERRRG